MATIAKPNPASAAHVERFTKKLHSVRKAAADLPGDDFYNNLINIIHRPGWTTPAEVLFFESVVDSIVAQTQHLAQLQQQLMAAAEAVGQE
jgi:hypothetical protein